MSILQKMMHGMTLHFEMKDLEEDVISASEDLENISREHIAFQQSYGSLLVIAADGIQFSPNVSKEDREKIRDKWKMYYAKMYCAHKYLASKMQKLIDVSRLCSEFEKFI